MANNLTDYAENKLLDHLLGTAAYTMPTQVYLALFTAASSQETPTVTEVSTGGYAREAIDFSAAASGATSNSGVVSFTASGGNFGDVTHIGLSDDPTAGNWLMVGALTSPKTVNDGDTLQFAAGDVDVSMD